MYRFVVIDDEELIRKGTLKKLSPLMEYISCVGEADNGKSAIELIEKVRPDFAILDMQMPVMHGMELLPYLAENYPDMALIVISGYRNFDYIKQAISSNAVEYLLKPFSAESIQNCVRQIIDKFDTKTEITEQIRSSEEAKAQTDYDYDMNLLHNLIFGYHVQDTTLRSKKLNYINNTHNLVLLSINYAGPAMQNDVQRWLSENGFGDLAIYISDNSEEAKQGFIILFFPHQNVISNKNLINQVINSLTSWIDFAERRPFIGISDVHHSLSELESAYSETTAALDGKSIEDNSNEIFWFTNNPEPAHVTWERQDEFLFRIEAGMTDEVSALCDELFDFYKKQPDFRIADIKYHLSTLTEECRQIIKRYLPQTRIEQESHSVQRVVYHMFSIEELQTYFTRFFCNISIMLLPKSIYADSDTIEKIKIYIQRNYRKKLTQDFIASLFYLNSSYLSTLFREKTGTKFVDFLNDVRIEAAEALLEKSTQKISQIASAVGYDNEKYFFRIFKKRTGLTPEQYRSRLFSSPPDLS